MSIGISCNFITINLWLSFCHVLCCFCCPYDFLDAFVLFYFFSLVQVWKMLPSSFLLVIIFIFWKLRFCVLLSCQIVQSPFMIGPMPNTPTVSATSSQLSSRPKHSIHFMDLNCEIEEQGPGHLSLCILCTWPQLLVKSEKHFCCLESLSYKLPGEFHR